MSTSKFLDVTMADLITSDLRTDSATPIARVAELWEANPHVDGMAILGDGRVRYLSRSRFFVQLGKRFGYSLFENRPVTLLAEDGATVEADMDPIEVVALATQRDPERVYDDLLVVEAGAFRGLVSMRSLLVHHKSLLGTAIAERALLEQRNRQLQELNDDRREFIAELTRQVRAPVDTMLGLARHLLAEVRPDDSSTETVNLILARGYDALSVVNDLQELAMLERGEITPQLEPTELPPLFAEADREARVLLAGRALRLDVDTKRAPERFTTDAVIFRRILSHLLAGSVRRTTEGSLSLVAVETPDGLELTVRHTGTADVDKGADVRPSASDLAPGGRLTALRALVDLVEGRIEVEGSPLEGSRIAVTLPASSDPGDQGR